MAVYQYIAFLDRYLNTAGQPNKQVMKNTILVVDDNADLLQITTLILRAQGYSVMCADTVQQATTLIESEHPQLILLDVCICEEDGIAFCHQLKQKAATKGIRVILMSGNEYEEKEWNVADDFLLKPFDFNTMTQKIMQQLSFATQPLPI